jgi:hypothetical protein
MFKLAPSRNNREFIGSLQSLQSAVFVGIFIPVQTHMRIIEIVTGRGFRAEFWSSLSRSAQNIPQGLRYTLR